MITRLSTYWLLAAMIFQSFYLNILVADYEINLPEYIAQCINKDKPKMKCNGKCALSKKMDEEQKNESKSKIAVSEYNSLYVPSNFASSLYEWSEPIVEKHYLHYLNNYTYSYYSALLRPPAC